METIAQFQYTYENMFLYQFQNDWLLFGEVLIGGILGLIIISFLIRLIAFISLAYNEAKILEKKKKTLGDLILMKDIQSELEKEIEQAILKAAFHT